MSSGYYIPQVRSYGACLSLSYLFHLKETERKGEKERKEEGEGEGREQTKEREREGPYLG
jgi:hypothetical protein